MIALLFLKGWFYLCEKRGKIHKYQKTLKRTIDIIKGATWFCVLCRQTGKLHNSLFTHICTQQMTPVAESLIREDKDTHHTSNDTKYTKAAWIYFPFLVTVNPSMKRMFPQKLSVLTFCWHLRMPDLSGCWRGVSLVKCTTELEYKLMMLQTRSNPDPCKYSSSD